MEFVVVRDGRFGKLPGLVGPHNGKAVRKHEQARTSREQRRAFVSNCVCMSHLGVAKGWLVRVFWSSVSHRRDASYRGWSSSIVPAFIPEG